MEADSANRRHLKHELRTCLNQILGFGELLLESTVEDGKVALAAYVRAILGHAESMRQLIAALTQEPDFEEETEGTAIYAAKLRVLVSGIRLDGEAALQVAEAAYKHDLDQVSAANTRLLALLDSSFSAAE